MFCSIFWATRLKRFIIQVQGSYNGESGLFFFWTLCNAIAAAFIWSGKWGERQISSFNFLASSDSKAVWTKDELFATDNFGNWIIQKIKEVLHFISRLTTGTKFGMININTETFHCVQHLNCNFYCFLRQLYSIEVKAKIFSCLNVANTPYWSTRTKFGACKFTRTSNKTWSLGSCRIRGPNWAV